jgi:hypothetical protein
MVSAKVPSGVRRKSLTIHERADFQKRSGEVVSRRYSDFVWLLDCLSKRYVSW